MSRYRREQPDIGCWSNNLCIAQGPRQTPHCDGAILTPNQKLADHCVVIRRHFIAFGDAGSWPLWSWRTLSFYALSVLLWLGYFSGFLWLRNRLGRL